MFSKDEGKESGSRKSAAPTIISADLKIGGDLNSEGEIHIDGQVDGDVRCKKLSIGESGAIEGAVTTDDLLVRGKIEGQIRARMVSLTPTAQVTGDVYHETLCIEAGAQLDGLCHRLNGLEETPEQDDDVNINLVVEDGSVQPFNAKKT